MPPKAVVLVASDDAERNLSDEAWAAWNEPPVKVAVSMFSGRTTTVLARTGIPLTTVIGPVLERLGRDGDDEEGDPERTVDADSNGAGHIVTKPHPHVWRPRTATVKEALDAGEVATMLADETHWKLAVPNGSNTDVLTRSALLDACHTDASDTVTLALTAITAGDKAVFEDALEARRPKAGVARVATAIGTPFSFGTLLAAVTAGLVGWSTDLALARPYLLVAAGFLALAALILSLASTSALRQDDVNLSRIDRLRTRSGPPPWMGALVVGLFALALAAGVFAVFPLGSDGDPKATFGPHTSVAAGAQTKVTFTVSFNNLTADTSDVEVIVTEQNRESGGQAQLGGAILPRKTGGTATGDISVTVGAPAEITASAQPRDNAGNAVGKAQTHDYKIEQVGEIEQEGGS